MLLVLLSGFFLTTMLAVNSSAASTLVRVMSMTQIDEEQILLGKIAQIEGNDPHLVQQLHGIVIGRCRLRYFQVLGERRLQRRSYCGADAAADTGRFS